ncbi:unnamed protein product [Diatraea saccharalis]|uniref:SCP domain-containing protein n=1 Tax=Diatraea saccharalis TaxID=40085 RepID=A0A9N9REM1_9NEOP|nr:unnamed protein product [Diatraea saccharalis]
MGDTKVGQSIATVVGPTPGMYIQSLVDIWFTMSLDYKGSASYYNQSRDWKTNYFTQLIWADTDKVGCGKARFFVENKNKIIERLICNFAPKGNNHGKPVYAIGYPATQCKNNMVSDKEFHGLCSLGTQNNVRKFTLNKPPVSSLLRILNLSNNSVRQEIDPVRNKLSQAKFDYNFTNEQRNQKIRHVFFNNSYVARKNIPSMQTYNKWPSPENFSRNQQIQKYQQERGHSRVYHGHELHDHNFGSENKLGTYQSSTNIAHSTDSTDVPNEAKETNFRKYYQNHDCTRHQSFKKLVTPYIKNDCRNCDTRANVCTREHTSDNCAKIAASCHETTNLCLQNEKPECSCIPTTTCAPLPPKCGCNINCPCIKTDCIPTQCPPAQGFRRNHKLKEDSSTPLEFHYYDLLPNMEIRSGDNDNKKLHPKESSSKSPWVDYTTFGNNLKSLPYTPHYNENHDYVKDLTSSEKTNKLNSDYIYDFSDSRERKRRNLGDEMTFKPFWQMDEFNHQRPELLKSIKYTTLQKRKTKRTTLGKIAQTTEIITIKLKESADSIPKQKKNMIEKYLSFDELMHLRKFGSTEPNTIINARRADSNTTSTTTSKATSEYTTNTPFKRKKHCTRKLTCTWTAVTITDANGSVIGGGGYGGDGDRGSRTPPGYVDGCTRTSTCTRDYMDRNKFSTLSDSSDSTVSQLEDEDYCERRALNVHRRDSYRDSSILNNDRVTTVLYHMNNNADSTYISYSSTESCLCIDDKLRIKRNEKNNSVLFNNSNIFEGERDKRSYEILSYGNLYYLLLQKIIDTWKRSHRSANCFCNAGTVLIKGSILFIALTFMFNLLLNNYK